MKTILQIIFSTLIIALMVYGVFYYADLHIGSVMDWVVGIISFIWLTTIVVVPWNAHFKAREVLDDAAISQRKDILVIDSSLEYVKKVAKHSLYVAVGLHLFTAIVLYFIAHVGISPVGYFSALAAILLTFFRPALRFYEYLQKRLGDIRQEFRYPREDLRELLNQVKTMNSAIDGLKATLETDPEKPSWRQDVEHKHQAFDEKVEAIEQLINQHKIEAEKVFDEYQVNTHERFTQLSEEGKQRVERLIADSKILESVRVLAGFVKEIKG